MGILIPIGGPSGAVRCEFISQYSVTAVVAEHSSRSIASFFASFVHLHLCRRCHVVLHIYAASRVVSQQHCGVSSHISEMGSVVIYIIVPSHCLAEWISADL